MNCNVDSFETRWMPWRKGADSCNACYEKWMLTLEANCHLEANLNTDAQESLNLQL